LCQSECIKKEDKLEKEDVAVRRMDVQWKSGFFRLHRGLDDDNIPPKMVPSPLQRSEENEPSPSSGGAEVFGL
jgi:hypothetical protein